MMPTLLSLGKFMGGSTVRVDVSETNIESRFRGTTTMRLVFNMTLTVDVSPNDDELRRAFLELITQSARTVYGPAAMLAKNKPILKITETSREGMVEVPLFAEAYPDAD
jgi:hypothetical protein